MLAIRTVSEMLIHQGIAKAIEFQTSLYGDIISLCEQNPFTVGIIAGSAVGIYVSMRGVTIATLSVNRKPE